MKKEKTSRIRLSSDKGIVLFDGFCNLCSWSVQFILKRDPKDYFKFAALQSEVGKQLLMQLEFAQNLNNSVILIEKDKVYSKSEAALKITRKLRGLWPIFYIFILIPKPVRDYIYNMIARNRFNWFGKKDSCYVPEKDYSEKFYSSNFPSSSNL